MEAGGVSEATKKGDVDKPMVLGQWRALPGTRKYIEEEIYNMAKAVAEDVFKEDTPNVLRLIREQAAAKRQADMSERNQIIQQQRLMMEQAMDVKTQFLNKLDAVRGQLPDDEYERMKSDAVLEYEKIRDERIEVIKQYGWEV